MTPEDTNQAPQSEPVAPAVGARERGEPAASEPGAPPPDWCGAIRDDGLRKHAERFASLDDLIQGNINLRKRLSTGAVVPGDDASEAERAEFRRRTGVPDKPSGYGVAPPPGVPAALLPTVENGGIARQAKFLDVFHRHNLTPAAVGDILSLYYAEAGGDMAAAVEADRAYAEKCGETLRAEWGGDNERNHTLAERAAEQIFAGDFEAVR